MGLLDANAAQLISSEGSFAAKAAMMRATIGQAEGAAMASQAHHIGESSAAFQASHGRFVEAAAKVNMLLDIASAQLGEGGQTYLSQDAAAAAEYPGATASL